MTPPRRLPQVASAEINASAVGYQIPRCRRRQLNYFHHPNPLAGELSCSQRSN